MFVKLKIKPFSIVAMQLLVVIFFVSITLAEEDGKTESQESRNSSGVNTTKEEKFRSAGIIFPSFDEIRESFKRFQDHVNNFRRNGVGYSTSDPRQLQNLSNSNSNGNYARNGNLFGSSSIPVSDQGSDDSESIYPPAFRRPNPNTYYKTSTTSTTADLQHHTTTTIYIICVCLIIMVIGSILFICVNKCQETPNFNSSSNSNRNNRTSRRNNLSSGSSSNRNSRISVSTISIAIPSSVGSPSGSSSNIPAGTNIDYDAKFGYDMPPSYDSLFPTGK